MELTLRKAGSSSVVVTLPKNFLKQNNLGPGSKVEVNQEGRLLTLAAPAPKKYTLEGLLAEMPAEIPMVADWNNMPAVGLERIE